jgi:hypothetical protein
MDKLLQSKFIVYLQELNPNVRNVAISEIRTDVTYESNFDIQDLRPTIIQTLGTGSVTYNNPHNQVIAIIDYEDFINKQPHQPECSSNEDVIKALELRKPDFIVYDLETNSFFVLNELSQSTNPANKRNDAKLQLNDGFIC